MMLRPALFVFVFPQALCFVAQAQNSAPVTLAGPDLRVEVRSINGRLEEQYQARTGTRWTTVASSAGETEGPVSVHGANGGVLSGVLHSVSIEGGALIERLAAGQHEITRTVKLIDRSGW